MRKFLYAVLLVIAGILITMTYEWARENYVPSPAPRVKTGDARVQFPDYNHLRVNALRRYSEIPPAERDRLKQNLRSAMVHLNDWLDWLENASPELICLGEKHDDYTRDFLARRFFSRYPTDVLMLEMRDRDLEIVSSLVQAGSPRLSLLNADITGILRSAMRANPGVEVHAIEETREQLVSRLNRHSGSREDSILKNFEARFERGRRNVVLYGALHCTDDAHWLLNKIRTEQRDVTDTLGVNVVNAHGGGGIESFVNFAEDIGLTSPPFVIPRTAMLDDEIYSWFPPLAQLFRSYDAVIVFDPKAADRRGPR